MALIGSYQSAVAVTISQTAERYQIPFLSADNSSPSLHRQGLRSEGATPTCFSIQAPRPVCEFALKVSTHHVVLSDDLVHRDARSASAAARRISCGCWTRRSRTPRQRRTRRTHITKARTCRARRWWRSDAARSGAGASITPRPKAGCAMAVSSPGATRSLRLRQARANFRSLTILQPDAAKLRSMCAHAGNSGCTFRYSE